MQFCAVLCPNFVPKSSGPKWRLFVARSGWCLGEIDQFCWPLPLGNTSRQPKGRPKGKVRSRRADGAHFGHALPSGHFELGPRSVSSSLLAPNKPRIRQFNDKEPPLLLLFLLLRKRQRPRWAPIGTLANCARETILIESQIAPSFEEKFYFSPFIFIFTFIPFGSSWLLFLSPCAAHSTYKSAPFSVLFAPSSRQRETS